VVLRAQKDKVLFLPREREWKEVCEVFSLRWTFFCQRLFFNLTAEFYNKSLQNVTIVLIYFDEPKNIEFLGNGLVPKMNDRRVLAKPAR